jgi:hypothetical protein
MKILITEEQREKFILKIPGPEFFGGWDNLQKFLKKKGNPDYEIIGNLDLRGTSTESLGNLISVGGNLYLERTPISIKYSEEEIRGMINVKGDIYLNFS